MSNKLDNVFISNHEDGEALTPPHEDQQSHEQQNDHSSQDPDVNEEEIDQLLQQQAQAKQVMILKFKVNELQKICQDLTNTNRRLIEKLSAYEQERDDSRKQDQIFVDQYSELNNEFTQVQSLIEEYKQSLDQFHKSALADMRSKQERIHRMKLEIKQLLEHNNELLAEKEQQVKINRQLETRNEGLILQIESLEKEKQRLEQRMQMRPQHYHHYSGRYDSHHADEDLPTEVQNQYEQLIDRIVKELEYERSVKKKMGDEIRRMSQELMDSEREIMDKNKRIYEMEMKLLRNSKTTADSSLNYASNKFGDAKSTRKARNTQKNGGRLDYPEGKVSFKGFILLELINGELNQQISVAERKIIGIKIVQFYQRKLQRQDYTSIMPENLSVCNFSHKRPELLSIRRDGTSSYQDGEKSQEGLVWNLAFILDNLFGDGIEDFNEILQLTGQVLQKQVENNREVLEVMKELLVI